MILSQYLHHRELGAQYMLESNQVYSITNQAARVRFVDNWTASYLKATGNPLSVEQLRRQRDLNYANYYEGVLAKQHNLSVARADETLKRAFEERLRNEK